MGFINPSDTTSMKGNNMSKHSNRLPYSVQSSNELNKGLLVTMAELAELESRYMEAANYYLQAAKEVVKECTKENKKSFDHYMDKNHEMQEMAMLTRSIREYM